jgi:hypothetical protein
MRRIAVAAWPSGAAREFIRGQQGTAVYLVPVTFGDSVTDRGRRAVILGRSP